MRCWTTKWLAAPSIKWGLSWKHSENVNRICLNGLYFGQMAIDYKYRDLDYKIQEKDYKNADLDHRMACSTINKMGVVIKTLVDGVEDLPGPILSWCNTNRPWVHWAGLQAIGNTTQLLRMPNSESFQKRKRTENAILWTPLVTPLAHLDILGCWGLPFLTYGRWSQRASEGMEIKRHWLVNGLLGQRTIRMMFKLRLHLSQTSWPADDIE